MISFDLNSENLLSILGALYDIAGALVLARGLAFVRAGTLLRQGLTGTWDMNPQMIKVFAEQRVDGWVGLILLGLGFSIQGLAGYGYKTTDWIVFGAGVVGLAVIVLFYFTLRRRLTTWGFVRACQRFRRPDGTQMTDSQIEANWLNA